MANKKIPTTEEIEFVRLQVDMRRKDRDIVTRYQSHFRKKTYPGWISNIRKNYL